MFGFHIDLTGIDAVIFIVIQAAMLLFLFSMSVRYNSKFFLVLAIILSGFCVGMRFNYGLDTQMYAEWVTRFGTRSGLGEAFLWSDHERSFIIISYFSYKLTGSYRLAFLIYATSTAGFFLTGLWNFRKKINVYPGLLYYIVFLQWNSMCNIMRQSLAIAIVFWGIQFVYKKEPIKFFVAVLGAFLFHSSALAAIPLYFYGDENFRGRKYLPMINVGLIILLSIAPSLLVEIMTQISHRYDYSLHYKFGLGFVVNIVILYIFFKYSYELADDVGLLYMIRSLLILATILLISDYTIGEAARFREYYNTIYLLALGAIPSEGFVLSVFRKKKISYLNAIMYGYPLLYLINYLRGFLNGSTIAFAITFMN